MSDAVVVHVDGSHPVPHQYPCYSAANNDTQTETMPTLSTSSLNKWSIAPLHNIVDLSMQRQLARPRQRGCILFASSGVTECWGRVGSDRLFVRAVKQTARAEICGSQYSDYLLSFRMWLRAVWYIETNFGGTSEMLVCLYQSIWASQLRRQQTVLLISPHLDWRRFDNILFICT